MEPPTTPPQPQRVLIKFNLHFIALIKFTIFAYFLIVFPSCCCDCTPFVSVKIFSPVFPYKFCWSWHFPHQNCQLCTHHSTTPDFCFIKILISIYFSHQKTPISQFSASITVWLWCFPLPLFCLFLFCLAVLLGIAKPFPSSWTLVPEATWHQHLTLRIAFRWFPTRSH